MIEQEQQHQQSLMSRIGNWFKRGGEGRHGEADGTSPEFIVNNENGTASDITGEPAMSGQVVEPRSTFLRPWAKRDAAIENLQSGLSAIGDLMGGIREHMEKQSKRQDELLGYLSHLPAALEQLPESNRAHAEALKAIHESMNRQGAQQSKLGEILERITQADGQTGRTLQALTDHVEQLRRHDQAVAENLNQVGDAMENLGKNTATSATVLQQLRDNSATRDSDIERILQQQTNRFTVLLVVATLLMVSTLVAVGALGYMFLQYGK
jgi:uncharacterized phage infection (PIP) family protein YhgE